MADLYADEQFPKAVVDKLRALGHDVLTVQDANNRGDSDPQVLAFATSQKRTVLTFNRKDFIKLHRQSPEHAGIIVCKQDVDWNRLAANIQALLAQEMTYQRKLMRVTRA